MFITFTKSVQAVFFLFKIAIWQESVIIASDLNREKTREVTQTMPASLNN